MARGHEEFSDGHYASISREHRKAIEDASKLLLSPDHRKREHALRVLMTIYDHDKVCPYHKAKICGVLADLGSQDLKDVEPWAIECVDLCHEIIEVEQLAPGSCARQSFDDMIYNAQAVLAGIAERDEEDKEMELEEECENEEEEEMGEPIKTGDAADEFEEDFLQGLSDFEQKDTDSNALSSLITQDPNYQEFQNTNLEFDVTIDEAQESDATGGLGN